MLAVRMVAQRWRRWGCFSIRLMVGPCSQVLDVKDMHVWRRNSQHDSTDLKWGWQSHLWWTWRLWTSVRWDHRRGSCILLDKEEEVATARWGGSNSSQAQESIRESQGKWGYTYETDHNHQTVTQDHSCQSVEYIQLLSGWQKTLHGARDYKPQWRWWIIPDLTDRCLWSPSARRQEPDNIHKSDKMLSMVPIEMISHTRFGRWMFVISRSQKAEIWQYL